MSVSSRNGRAKAFAATWLYRWGMAQGIIGALFSALTFAGVFTLLLGPYLQEWGLGQSGILLMLIGLVTVLFFTLGTVLDRVVKFWQAQVEVGTTRNQYLIDKLYQKELLNIKVHYLPALKAMRSMLNLYETNFKTQEACETARKATIAELDAAIARLVETVQAKKWTIQPEEDIYEHSS